MEGMPKRGHGRGGRRGNFRGRRGGRGGFDGNGIRNHSGRGRGRGETNCASGACGEDREYTHRGFSGKCTVISQEMDTPECCICYEGLDDSTRRPRCLPCGHTICTLCIDMSIEEGDRSCSSCRQPHHVSAANKLPINYALEEILKKLTVKSCETNRMHTEMCGDGRKKKENIISETRDFIFSFKVTVLELQNEICMKENHRDNNQAQIEQKLAEVECLRKDIQEENKVIKGHRLTVNEMEDEIEFLENSVQNIQISKNSTNIFNIYEDIKRKLKSSTLHNNATNKKDSQPSEDYHNSRTVKLVKRDGLLGIIPVGGSDYGLPIYIYEIIPDSAAHRHGGLKPGDRLLRFNGVSVKKCFNINSTLELIQSMSGEISMDVLYTPGALEKTREVYQTLGKPMPQYLFANNNSVEDTQPSEEYHQSRIVKLFRKGSILGFVTAGGSEYGLPIYICEILPNTTAERQGGIKPGDCLLSVNGRSLEGFSRKRQHEVVKSANGNVKLEVRYTPGAMEMLRERDLL